MALPTGIAISQLFTSAETSALGGTKQPWRAIVEDESAQVTMVFSHLGKLSENLGILSKQNLDEDDLHLIPLLLFIMFISGGQRLFAFN